jgi:hypothetical protein
LITDEASEEEEEDGDQSEEDQENGSLVGITKSGLRARPKNAQKEKARRKADLLRRVSRIVSKKKKGDKVIDYYFFNINISII